MSEERPEYAAGAKPLYMVFDVESVGLHSDKQLYFVLDCESVGIHGECFAWGYVVVDGEGNEVDSDYAACSMWDAFGLLEDRAWVEANVAPHCPKTHDAFLFLRTSFWQAYTRWRDAGALLYADVPYPVETNFLNQCITDSWQERQSRSPYPLLDIASIRFAAGLDPLETCPRLPDELPAHNPLNDARQSARLLVEALALLEERRSVGL